MQQGGWQAGTQAGRQIGEQADKERRGVPRRPRGGTTVKQAEAGAEAEAED